MKTALAPTAELATQRVKKYVETKIVPALGNAVTLKEFYLCNPSTSSVMNYKGEKWYEGNWGIKILCEHFCLSDLLDADTNKQIVISDFSIRVADNSKIELVIWLTARVMR